MNPVQCTRNPFSLRAPLSDNPEGPLSTGPQRGRQASNSRNKQTNHYITHTYTYIYTSGVHLSGPPHPRRDGPGHCSAVGFYYHLKSLHTHTIHNCNLDPGLRIAARINEIAAFFFYLDARAIDDDSLDPVLQNVD